MLIGAAGWDMLSFFGVQGSGLFPVGAVEEPIICYCWRCRRTHMTTEGVRTVARPLLLDLEQMCTAGVVAVTLTTDPLTVSSC